MTHIELIQILRKNTSRLRFEPGDSYFWSPKDKTVFYQAEDSTDVGQWTLLHELSHALLGHASYQSDFELIKLEVQAWERARLEGERVGLKINEDHIQDCLDSYRDWQYKRSLCPMCNLGGVQINQRTYRCLFCDRKWNVSEARFCRPYRRKADLT